MCAFFKNRVINFVPAQISKCTFLGSPSWENHLAASGLTLQEPESVLSWALVGSLVLRFFPSFVFLALETKHSTAAAMMTPSIYSLPLSLIIWPGFKCLYRPRPFAATALIFQVFLEVHNPEPNTHKQQSSPALCASLYSVSVQRPDVGLALLTPTRYCVSLKRLTIFTAVPCFFPPPALAWLGFGLTYFAGPAFLLHMFSCVRFINPLRVFLDSWKPYLLSFLFEHPEVSYVNLVY